MLIITASPSMIHITLKYSTSQEEHLVEWMMMGGKEVLMESFQDRQIHENHEARSGSSCREEDERRRSPRRERDHDNQVHENEEARWGISCHKHPGVPKLTAEEKAACSREMKLDVELHEERKWKRLKKASEADAWEIATICRVCMEQKKEGLFTAGVTICRVA